MAQHDEPQLSHAGGPSERSELTKDDVFHVLQNERRRLAIRYLLGRDTRVSVETLTDQVAAWEHGVPVEEVPREQRQRIHLDLYQSHLPKLQKFGLVDYDQSGGGVEPTGSFEEFEPFLDLPASGDGDAAARRKGDWLEYYAGTAVASALLLGLTWLGPLSTMLSFRVAAAVIAAVYAVLTAGLLVSRGV